MAARCSVAVSCGDPERLLKHLHLPTTCKWLCNQEQALFLGSIRLSSESSWKQVLRLSSFVCASDVGIIEKYMRMAVQRVRYHQPLDRAAGDRDARVRHTPVIGSRYSIVVPSGVSVETEVGWLYRSLDAKPRGAPEPDQGREARACGFGQSGCTQRLLFFTLSARASPAM